jgi:hypothetical protein
MAYFDYNHLEFRVTVYIQGGGWACRSNGLSVKKLSVELLSVKRLSVKRL